MSNPNRGKKTVLVCALCALVALAAAGGWLLFRGGDPPPDVGDVIEFGPYNWRVLDVRDGQALIITEEILEQRVYHELFTWETWETSDMRLYLNSDFLQTFTPGQREQIAATELANHDNPWFGTPGGNGTTDRVFLLSLEEVVQYFGDSGQLTGRPGDTTWWIDDKYNQARVAADSGGAGHWWWLRSPGIYNNLVASVHTGGRIGVDGIRADDANGGLRPALWLIL